MRLPPSPRATPGEASQPPCMTESFSKMMGWRLVQSQKNNAEATRKNSSTAAVVVPVATLAAVVALALVSRPFAARRRLPTTALRWVA